MTIGGTRISWVPDGHVQLKPRGWYPDTTDADWRGLRSHLDVDGRLVASVGGVLVQRDGRAMLIDAGFGDLHTPDSGDPIIGDAIGGTLPRHLREFGIGPDGIELMAITHLHTDHIGGALADAHAAPALRSASILVDHREWKYTADRHSPGFTPALVDSLTDRVTTIADEQEIWPGVRAVGTPGHTPGHTSYLITDGDQQALVLGDALHSSIQVRHPDWRSAPDTDPANAVASRHVLLNLLTSRPDIIGVGGHFADEIFGRVTNNGGGHGWQTIQ